MPKSMEEKFCKIFNSKRNTLISEEDALSRKNAKLNGNIFSIKKKAS